jgi:hypothetical protein
MVEKKDFELFTKTYLAAGEMFDYDGDSYVTISILEVRSNWEGKCIITALVVKQ